MTQPSSHQFPPPPPPAPNVLKTIPPLIWVRTLLIVLVFLGGSLVMAAISAALIVSGLGPDQAFGPVDEFQQFFQGGPSWIVFTFQLLAMGFLSPLSIGIEIAQFGGFSASGSLFFVPWFVPAGGIAAVAATQRFLGGNLRVPYTWVRLMLAGLAGLVFATVVTVLAATIRFRFDGGFDEVGQLWAHSASLPGFLVAGVLLGFITYVLLLPQRGVLLQRVFTGMAAVFEHVITLAVLCAVALLIAALVNGESEAVMPILFALPTIGFAGVSMLHFIPAVMSENENITDFAQAESMTMFDFPVAAWIIAIVVMVIALFIAALRWSIRARLQAGAVWSWITLPVTYLLVGVLLTAANGMYFSFFMVGEGLQASMHNAAWGFLVWLLVGGIIQVLAVYVTPQLVYRLPAGMVRALGIGLALPPTISKHPTPVHPTPAPEQHPEEPGPEPAGQPTAQMDHTGQMDQTAVMAAVGTSPQQPHDAWAAPHPVGSERGPMSRKSKVLLFCGLGVLVLGAAAWISHTVLARTVYGPQHTAEAYLQAVVDGRADDALQAVGPNVTDELRALATDEVYQAAEDRPDSFELGDVDRDGSTTMVEATVYQSGKSYPLELELTTSGTQAGVFSDWAIESGDLAGRAVYTAGPSQLTVNEVDVDVEPTGHQNEENTANEPDDELDDESVERLAGETGQVLLPGTYTFTAPEGSEYLSHGDDLELTITPGQVSTTPIEFNQSYTSAFEDDAISQIEQRLESCLADATIRIDDCEAASWEDTAWTAMTDMERTWDRAPEVELVPANSDPYFDSEHDLTDYAGPVIARITDGSINLTYQVRDDEDDDWMDRERVYSPFEIDFEPMEFPVSIDDDEISVDYSALNEYNPDWLSQDFR